MDYNNYYFGVPNFMEPMRNLQVPEPPPCPDGTIYTIRPGDTMFRIADRYGISLSELIAANPQITNPNVIFEGQRICIPAIIDPTPPPPEEFCPEGIIYVARRGDSMFTIARRFGVTLQRLIRANPQVADPNIIEVGQRICIPIPGVPLPEGIVKVELEPQIEGVLGATTFINVPDPTVWISTFGLPKPSDIDKKFDSYYAWITDRETERFFRVKLKDAGVPNIMVGYDTTTGTFEGYDEIIVTAEGMPDLKRPTGPIVLRGRITTSA